MARRHDPVWCTRTDHQPAPQCHQSDPVEVPSVDYLTVLHLEQFSGGHPYLVVERWYTPADPEDQAAATEPDDLVLLDLATAAALSAGLAQLVARALTPKEQTR